MHRDPLPCVRFFRGKGEKAGVRVCLARGSQAGRVDTMASMRSSELHSVRSSWQAFEPLMTTKAIRKCDCAMCNVCKCDYEACENIALQ